MIFSNSAAPVALPMDRTMPHQLFTRKFKLRHVPNSQQEKTKSLAFLLGFDMI
jgi:hypothetical protein